MTWQENIQQWRSLPPAEQLRLSLSRSPMQVWQSMAFERDPVSLRWLQAQHERLLMPQELSTPPKAD